jgi:hypothetical protein
MTRLSLPVAGLLSVLACSSPPVTSHQPVVANLTGPDTSKGSGSARRGTRRWRHAELKWQVERADPSSKEAGYCFIVIPWLEGGTNPLIRR